MNTDSAIEAILFFKGEPVSKETLADILEVSKDEVEHSLSRLSESLGGRGVRLVQDGENVELATASEAHNVIEKVTKRELTKKLGRAGMETLTVVLYRGPIARRDIDYIRGVNSSSVLRNLLIRGLITKRTDETARTIVYEPTTELLRHLGITKVTEMPEYERAQEEIQQFYHESDPISHNEE